MPRIGSTALVFRSTVDNLEQTKTVRGNVLIRIRMKRRFSGRQGNPIFAFDVSGQARARHCRQAQRAVIGSAVHVIWDLAVHRTTIALPRKSIRDLTLPDRVRPRGFRVVPRKDKVSHNGLVILRMRAGRPPASPHYKPRARPKCSCTSRPAAMALRLVLRRLSSSVRGGPEPTDR